MQWERKRARPRSGSFAVYQPTLLQFLLLSMLLHVLLVVLFGNPTGGAARRGEGWWGPLDVTLRRFSPESGSGVRLAPGTEKGAPSDTLLRRLRDAAAPPAAEKSENVRPEAARTSPEERQDAGDVKGRESLEALPRLNPEATQEVDKPLTSPAVTPARIERVTPTHTERELAAPAELPAPPVSVTPSARLESLVPQPIERELTPPVELPSRAMPVAPFAPLERVAPPPAERELAPAPKVPRREIPAAPAAPLERLAPPQIERDLAPPAPLSPSAIPATPAAPLERIAPPQIGRELAPPAPLPPSAIPATPAAPLERIAPPQIGRDLAPPAPLSPSAIPATPTAPLERVTPARIERSIAPPVDIPSAVTAPPGMSQPGASSAAPLTPAQPQTQPLPPPRFGTPEASDDIFKPRRDAGSPAETPRIDLDAARKKAAREIVSEDAGSRGVFTIPSPPPAEKKSKAAMAMEKALKPDCRTAYANLGLLAVPVLVASAIADDGSCRW